MKKFPLRTYISMVPATIKYLFFAAILIWQKIISPFLGPRCRFYPSCSQYAKESLKHDSLGKALYKTCLRLLKCHPFHPGGIDLP